MLFYRLLQQAVVTPPVTYADVVSKKTDERESDIIARRQTSGSQILCEAVPGLIVYRLYGPLIFANARYVVARIRSLVGQADGGLRCFVLDAQAISDIDVTAAQRFSELHHELTEAGIELVIADSPRPFREQLERIGLSTAVGSEHFFVSVKKAVEAFEERQSRTPGTMPG